ncbi:MAG TPA: hypothetical protein VH044_01240, partial [Polyangiaceae bacterium]|nr:hypothetical protein [Polyangiaceae bacterium]
MPILGLEPSVAAQGLLSDDARRKLSDWIASIAGDALRIAKIRRDEGPDGRAVDKLELLFKGDQNAFVAFLRSVKAERGWSFPERLLLKFARLLQRTPSDTAVEIIVGETDYATYVATRGGLVVLEPSVLKDAHGSLSIDLTGVTGIPALSIDAPTAQTMD